MSITFVETQMVEIAFSLAHIQMIFCGKRINAFLVLVWVTQSCVNSSCIFIYTYLKSIEKNDACIYNQTCLTHSSFIIIVQDLLEFGEMEPKGSTVLNLKRFCTIIIKGNWSNAAHWCEYSFFQFRFWLKHFSTLLA